MILMIQPSPPPKSPPKLPNLLMLQPSPPKLPSLLILQSSAPKLPNLLMLQPSTLLGRTLRCHSFLNPQRPRISCLSLSGNFSLPDFQIFKVSFIFKSPKAKDKLLVSFGKLFAARFPDIY